MYPGPDFWHFRKGVFCCDCPWGNSSRLGVGQFDPWVTLGSSGLERFCFILRSRGTVTWHKVTVEDSDGRRECAGGQRYWAFESEGYLLLWGLLHWGGSRGGQGLGTNLWLYLSLHFTRIWVWSTIGLFWTQWAGIKFIKHLVKNLAGDSAPSQREAQCPNYPCFLLAVW